MRKILIIHAGAVGDFILALPALAALRQAHPYAHIEIIGHPAILELGRLAEYVDQITPLSRSELHHLFVTGQELSIDLALRLSAYDGVVSWFGAADPSYRAALTARSPHAIIERGLPRPDRAQHATDYLLDTIKPLLPPHFIVTERAPRLPIPLAHRRAAATFLAERGLLREDQYILAIHPGSGSLRKCWPAEQFAELANELEDRRQAKVLLIEGPADAAPCRSVAAHRGHRPTVHLRQPSLTDLAAVLSHCTQFVGNDSGVTHLAAAVGIPTLAFFGPTDPQIWGPRGSSVRILHQPLGQLATAAALAAISTTGSP
ncbi:MAG: glycosyltransferase family 9 protein [Acidobacteria bacterium]|nr:glycosyltransferase family 9 protein [Acidobacteriota bacterium]MBI3656299.1 glycosyltransferase family 9 protein [Acidobacteriota bacterium]